MPTNRYVRAKTIAVPKSLHDTVSITTSTK